MQQSACTGATSQRWQFVPTSVSGYYEVLNENAQTQGESWNITGGTGATGQGVPLQTWNYGGTANTNALFAGALQYSGYYTFTAGNSGLCLGAVSAGAESSSRSTPATAPRPRRSAWCRNSAVSVFTTWGGPLPRRGRPRYPPGPEGAKTRLSGSLRAWRGVFALTGRPAR